MTTGSLILVGAGVVAVLGVVVLATQVDDWRRDFTTNVAETRAGASDSLLQPVTIARPVPEVADLIAEVTASFPGWSAATRTDTAGSVRLTFVRTTRLFRFKDDVVIWVEPGPDGTTVRARSSSRVGRGDLGQNPRTLRLLMRAIRERIGPPPS